MEPLFTAIAILFLRLTERLLKECAVSKYAQKMPLPSKRTVRAKYDKSHETERNSLIIRYPFRSLCTVLKEQFICFYPTRRNLVVQDVFTGNSNVGVFD